MLRAGTWNTVGVNSPTIFYMFGTIRSKPWDAVKVVVSTPVWSGPVKRPGPPSLCISITWGSVPQILFCLVTENASAC